MDQFRYLPHTADAEFQAFGKTFAEALCNAGRAVTNLITDVKKINPVEKHAVSVSAKSAEDLAVDFLEELVFLADTKGFLMCDASLDVKENCAHGFVYGDSAKNYETHGGVKAITRHDLRVLKNKNGYMIQVVVDV